MAITENLQIFMKTPLFMGGIVLMVFVIIGGVGWWLQRRKKSRGLI